MCIANLLISVWMHISISHYFRFSQDAVILTNAASPTRTASTNLSKANAKLCLSRTTQDEHTVGINIATKLDTNKLELCPNRVGFCPNRLGSCPNRLGFCPNRLRFCPTAIILPRHTQVLFQKTRLLPQQTRVLPRKTRVLPQKTEPNAHPKPSRNPTCSTSSS
jgi:hypothetical protein